MMTVHLPMRLVVKSQNSELQDVLAETAPDLKWTLAQLEAVSRQRMASFGAKNDDRAVLGLAARTASELLETGHIPDSLATDAWAAAHSNDLAAAATAVLAEVEVIISGRVADAIMPQRDAILSGLHDRLKAVLVEARSLPPMGGPDEAIDSGRVKEWQKFTALRSRYLGLREAQRVVMIDFQGSWQEPTASTAGYFRRYPLVHPGFWRPNADGFAIPNPVPEHEYDRFAWVVAHPDIEAWIPTVPELEEALADQRVFAALARESNPDVRKKYAKTMRAPQWIAAYLGVTSND
jgi:hypothetical protein